MSDSTPASAPPPPPPPPAPPATPAASGGSGNGKGSKKKAVAGGAGVVLLAAVAGGGAYAYNTLSGGGAQPSDVLPSTTQIYARVDLDPGASQKIELFKLLNKVPEVGETLGIEDPDKSDVRKLLFDEITENVCPDIDYDKDVEPWLGDRVGFGANINDEQFIIAIQVKDEGKAEDGIAQLFECADEDYGIAFYEGYALLSENQKDVDDALDATKKKSLSDNGDFADSTDALGEKGIASAWIDTKAIVETFADMPEFNELTDEQRKEIEDAGAAAMALRVDGNAIELAGVTSGEAKTLDGDSPIADLPKDTVAAISISGLGDEIADQWDLFLDELTSEFSPGASTFDDDFLSDLSEEERQYYEEFMQDDTFEAPDPQEYLDQFEAETGLKLPDDLAALLGKTFTLSIGGANLESIPAFSGPDDLTSLEIAIRTTDGENGSALDVMTKLADFASKNGVPLVAEGTDDGAVLATSSEAAEKVAGGGDLGDSDRFKAVMPFGDDTTQAFYLDVTTAIEKLLAADPPEEIRSQIDEAEFVDAIGFSAGNVDGHAKFSFRVNFSD